MLLTAGATSVGREVPPIRTFAEIAVLWIVADIGYYGLLPALGFRRSYSAEPVVIALYYALGLAVAVFAFWRLYRTWKPCENRPRTYALVLLMFGAIFLFAAYILPNLPTIIWTESWEPPELMVVTSWYFLPKSVEILLQQLLIVALVLSFSAQRFSIRAISIWCALLFGGAHLILAFGGLPFGYVTRFVAAAMAFAFVFPYLILRVPNGFIYSYALHWFYYIATIVMAHLLSPYSTFSST